jgi:hypothetical protein
MDTGESLKKNKNCVHTISLEVLSIYGIIIVLSEIPMCVIWKYYKLMYDVWYWSYCTV